MSDISVVSRSETITVQRKADVLTLHLAGDIGINAAPQLHAAAMELVQSEGDVVTVSEDITRCDLSTIQILLALKQELCACGRRFSLGNASRPVQEMLDFSGLTPALADHHADGWK